MKKFLTILTGFLCLSCSTTTKNKNEYLNNHGINNTYSTEKGDWLLGERVSGPTNARDTINGKVILTLNNNALVETAPASGKWILIGIKIKLTDQQQTNNSKIYPNTDLFSLDGEIIGKSKDTINLWMAEKGTGYFGAYTYTDNIKKQTIPERVLEKEIEKGNLSLSALKDFIEAYRFKEYNVNAELKYKQLFIYESMVVDPSPIDRITLLFDKKENLIGIIHSRKLKLSKYKSYKLIRGYSLTMIADIDKKEIQRIKKRTNKSLQFCGLK